MATSRRALNQHLIRNTENEGRKIATKGLKTRTGLHGNALGDIQNVAERALQSKLQQKSKIMETKKTFEVKDVENVENKNIDGMVRTCKAMSICENEPVITREVKAMSICENHFQSLITDIDKESEKDQFQCSEYAPDIYDYLRMLERKLTVGDYMQNQKEINEKMRSILVDWLIQVHGRFGLLQETLYLTISLIDRFLEHQIVTRSKLQLVGVSAMLLASKYEETYAPEIGDFVYITDNAYSKGQIKKMEQLILKAINYDISNPLCLHFLRRNSKAAVSCAKKHTLAKYLMELTVVDYKLARSLPSKIAAAALYLAGKVIDNAEWTDTLVHYSTYTEESLLPFVKNIAKLVAKSETSRFQATRTKYSSNKFMAISNTEELKGDYIVKMSQG